MRRLWAFALAALLLLGLWVWVRTEKKVLPLKVSGGILTDEQGQPAVLRGMSTHGLGWYPRYLNAGALQTLKRYGVNVISRAMYTEG